jgi:hypothetical protein
MHLNHPESIKPGGSALGARLTDECAADHLYFLVLRGQLQTAFGLQTRERGAHCLSVLHLGVDILEDIDTVHLVLELELSSVRKLRPGVLMSVMENLNLSNETHRSR